MKIRIIRKGGGFTLIEVLVAMALAALLMSMLLTSMIGTSDNYGAVSSQINTREEARAALSLCSSDLSAISGQISHNPSAAAGGWRTDELAFLANLAPQSQAIDTGTTLCQIYYYVAVTQDRGNNRPFSRKLFRKVRSSSEIFEMISAGTEVEPPAKRPEEDEPLAFGVVSYAVDFFASGEGGVRQPWTNESPFEPDLAKVTLVVTHRQLLERLTDESAWDEPSPLIGQSSDLEGNADLFQYTTTIFLGGKR